MVRPYNETLFGVMKESWADICFNVDEPWKHCVVRMMTITKDDILYDSILLIIQSSPMHRCGKQSHDCRGLEGKRNGRGLKEYVVHDNVFKLINDGCRTPGIH